MKRQVTRDARQGWGGGAGRDAKREEGRGTRDAKRGTRDARRGTQRRGTQKRGTWYAGRKQMMLTILDFKDFYHNLGLTFQV